ncbi:MAG: AMP-binding protein [Deltaproteobacteria bacterium]|nr:AMP-binding protein [Deltaproteobacteria bacterium]
MAKNLGDVCQAWSGGAGRPDPVALRLVRPDLSSHDHGFGAIDALAGQFANVLRDIGQDQGRVVALFLPKCIEVFASFLGSLKAKSVVLPLFANFGDLALVDRLADSGASCIVTRRSSLPRIERIRPSLPALEVVLLVDSETDQGPGVLSLPARMGRAKSEFASAAVDDDTPALIHYTSGSTGKPKGVLHVHGAAPHLERSMSEVMQLGRDDVYWCTADHGWITGTSYGILAPWLLGITQIQVMGSFEPGYWFRILAEQRVSVWYTAPTALRMLARADDIDYRSYDLSALRAIFSVGEPLNPEIGRWGREVLERDIHDTWFQTETGGIMIANRPGLAIRPGSMGKPVASIQAAVLDDQGRRCPARTTGHLCLRYPWTSMFRDYLHRTDSYRAKFAYGYYDSGDLAYEDEDGYFWFSARNDDVINTSGHLVSPFEVESALLELAEVAESGAVGVPDPVLFEKIVVFVALRKGVQASDELRLKIRLHVANRLSAAATPQDVVLVDRIPKNKSGKILRRVLRARYLGEDPGDLSTIEDQA